MRRRPPRSTRTDTLFPYTTLFRSLMVACGQEIAREIVARTEAALEAGEVSEAQLFDQDYLEIPGSNPPRFRTGLNDWADRSEEHTSELQSLMRISYAVFCLKKKKSKCHINTCTFDPKCIY